MTRKNLMHYLLTDQKEQELIKVRNVQRGARRFLARRRHESDAWFNKHLTSTTEMTLSDFHKSIFAFRLGLADFLPDPLEENQQKELMAFIDAPPAGSTISKIMFRKLLAKARQWRLKTMNAVTEANRAEAKEIEDTIVNGY